MSGGIVRADGVFMTHLRETILFRELGANEDQRPGVVSGERSSNGRRDAVTDRGARGRAAATQSPDGPPPGRRLGGDPTVRPGSGGAAATRPPPGRGHAADPPARAVRGERPGGVPVTP